MKREWPLQRLAELICNVPNFPKPGIVFKDITPILENSHAFRALAQHMREMILPGTTKLLAIESRGFILAAAIAQYAEVGVILIRKPGKLPRKTNSVSYELEYGRDELQVHQESLNAKDRVMVVDDVLATGGTAAATEKLATKSGATVLGNCFLIEITALRGGQKLTYPYRSLLKV